MVSPRFFLHSSDAEGFSFLDDPPPARPIPAVSSSPPVPAVNSVSEEGEESAEPIIDAPITRPFYCSLEELCSFDWNSM